nr:MAG TPA: hypothetical protein [Caudoviricetes sp.]
MCLTNNKIRNEPITDGTVEIRQLNRCSPIMRLLT